MLYPMKLFIVFYCILLYKEPIICNDGKSKFE